jgi:undecaprenyl-diphosphatase
MTWFKPIADQFDGPIFFFFQKIQSPGLDYILGWPTCLGESLMALTLLTLCILFLDKRRKFEIIASAVLAILTTHWVSEWLKHFFHRPRPCHYWRNVSMPFGLPHSLSFPSGHTAVIFAAAYVAGYFYPKLRGWAYAFAVWVALTRVYVGVHYPTDLLGGALLGVICGAVACRVVRFTEAKPKA